MQTSSPLEKQEDPYSAGLHNQTVIIADHVYANRKYLEPHLRSWHMRCLSAGSETALMDLLEQIAVDVVIINLSLPTRHDKNLVSQIRGIPIWCDLVIVGLTDHTDPSFIEQATASGVNVCIGSRPDPATLKNILIQHIKLRHNNRRAVIERCLLAEKNAELPPAITKPNSFNHESYYVAKDPDLAEFFSTRPLLDEDRLGNSRLLYKEHFQNLLESMIGTMKQRELELHKAIRNNDIEGISRLLHSLIGITGYAGANALRQYIKLRLYTKTCDGMLPGEATWFETVSDLITRSIEELEKYWVEKSCEIN